MAWTKMKTAVVVSVGLLLAAGATTVAVKEIQTHQGYQWQVQVEDLSTVLRDAPPMVKIVPTIFSNRPNHFISGIEMPIGSIREVNIMRIGFDTSVENMIFNAYSRTDKSYYPPRVILPKMPQERYDFIVNLPKGSSEALAQEIKRKFGFVARTETIETNILIMVVSRPNAEGLKPGSTD